MLFLFFLEGRIRLGKGFSFWYSVVFFFCGIPDFYLLNNAVFVRLCFQTNCFKVGQDLIWLCINSYLS